jgi:hypothetical protein
MKDPETLATIREIQAEMREQAAIERASRARVEQLTLTADPRRHPSQQMPEVLKADSKAQKMKKPTRASFLRPAGLRTQEQATYFLDLLSALVPKRIATEEIGDALELIDKMVKAKRPKWFVYLKVTTTFFWVGAHTLLHYAERVAGIVKVVTGKSDKH